MTAKFLLPLLCCSALHAAVIRGTVVEHATGKPLARSLVTVQPIAGGAAAPSPQRTDRSGGFEFQGLSAGGYVVTVARTGFATAQYGQKEWKSSGYPVFLEEAAATFLNVRLRRLGAIIGTVLDQEEIGLPDYEVAVYRNVRPPQLLDRAKTDDRGMFRIGGLPPGSYLVRTAGKQYEEGSYIPTFHRETEDVDQAAPVEVNLDEEVANINIKPHEGRLVSISGTINSPTAPVKMTLASETIRITQQGSSFRFDNLPPARYELYAESPGDSPSVALYGGYMNIAAERDPTEVSLQLVEVRPVRIQVLGTKGERVDSRTVQVQARRIDLAGTGEPVRLKTGEAVALAPGRWELMMTPPSDFYVAGFQGPRYTAPPNPRPEGWNETQIVSGSEFLRFTVSRPPAVISGVVIAPATQLALGAPVFLEGWDTDARRRVFLGQTRTDMRGQYQFRGLAPGTYRILGSFEYQSPDSAVFESAAVKSVKIDAGQALQADLELYVIP